MQTSACCAVKQTSLRLTKSDLSQMEYKELKGQVRWDTKRKMGGSDLWELFLRCNKVGQPFSSVPHCVSRLQTATYRILHMQNAHVFMAAAV